MMKSTDKTISDRNGIAIDDLEKLTKEWRKKFEKQVFDAHRKAYILGRRRAGNFRSAPRMAEKYAAEVMKTEKAFIDNFEKSILDGKYHTRLSSRGNDRLYAKTSQLDQRMLMYVNKARSSANDAFAVSSPESSWTRVMLAAEHCSTCPGKAKTYPSWAALKKAGIPSDGSDACKTNCECIIFREPDGKAGFSTIFEPDVVPVMEDNGEPSSPITIDSGKLDYLTEWRKRNDKSGLMKDLGFDTGNKADLLDELTKALNSDKFELEATNPSEAAVDGLKYTLKTTLTGPNATKKFELVVQQHPRKGLRFITLVPLD